MKTYYRDFYGCTASIAEHKDGTATLRICDPHGKQVFRATFKTLRGAKISMGKQSDCWEKRLSWQTAPGTPGCRSQHQGLEPHLTSVIN